MTSPSRSQAIEKALRALAYSWKTCDAVELEDGDVVGPSPAIGKVLRNCAEEVLAALAAQAEETRPRLTPEQKAEMGKALLGWMKVDDALRAKTNTEIGDLVLEHVWAQEELGSPRELLLSEAIGRLRSEEPPPTSSAALTADVWVAGVRRQPPLPRCSGPHQRVVVQPPDYRHGYCLDCGTEWPTAAASEPAARAEGARRVCVCGHGEGYHYNRGGLCGGEGCSCSLWWPAPEPAAASVAPPEEPRCPECGGEMRFTVVVRDDVETRFRYCPSCGGTGRAPRAGAEDKP